MPNTASIIVGYGCILPCIFLYTQGVIQHILLYLHAVGITTILFALTSQTSSSSRENELYGLKNLLVNLELPPKTFWFNMGLWDKENLSYSQACENLIRSVAEKMKIKSYSTILDVGFGCGDSCFFLAEQYKSRVKGITNEKSQLDIAQKRIPTSLQEHITLSCGSADDLQDHIPSTDSFDAIVSIDSAYHFDTRWDFLKNAFSLLKSKEGKIGLYDLAIEAELLEKATPLQKKLVEWICLSVHIPIQNLVTVDRYQEQMKTIGYDNIHIQALDKRQVFGGVSKSFQQQYELTLEYGVGVSFTNRMFLKVSSFFFGLLSEKPWIVPIIVTAEKSQ